MSERIQKVLANAGVASRREVERWIKQGRLVVGDAPARLGDRLSGTERVYLDGRLLKLSATRFPPQCIVYYKRVGELTTRKDPEGRRTVFRHFKPPRSGRWIAVGRLDINTAGLLLLTTDGELAHRLMHPSYEVSRQYAVRTLGTLTPEQTMRLRGGVQLDDGEARFDSISEQGGSGVNTWYRVALHEGRNREVRRLFDAIGVPVSRLLRTGFGPVALGNLRRGESRQLDAAELRALYGSVGLRFGD